MDGGELFYDDNQDLVDLSYEDRSARFFNSLLTRSESSLNTGLAKIDNSVRIWAHQASMKDAHALELLRCHLPTVMRLSLECPLKLVRECFTKLLQDLEEHGIAVPKPLTLGPSSFIPASEVQAVDTNNEEVARLFQDAFAYDGRISHIIQVMGDHPAYLECHIRCQHFMMNGDGMLPYQWRAMIGVLAVARHRCAPLVQLLLKSFVDLDGDSSWLQGIDHMPEKLRSLLTVNNILAHQPWLITPQHMEGLLKPGPNSWSMGELVHAVVLMAHWHAMAGFVFGCGINTELDMTGAHTHTVGATSESKSTTVAEDGRSASVTSDNGTTAAKSRRRSSSGSNGSSKLASAAGSKSVSSSKSQRDIDDLAEKMKGLNTVDDDEEETSESCRMDQFKELDGTIADSVEGTDDVPCPDDVQPFLFDPDFCHENFARRGTVSGVHPVRNHEYCWEDHGFSLVNRLYSDIGPLLDAKFSCVSSLTYNKVGDLENIDTTPFRQAIFNYIHSIKGIFHDDYKYSEVNVLLDRDLKSYVRKVTCFPETVTSTDFQCLQMFKASEQVHINVLLLEARLQAELLYALRALNAYITMRS